MELAAWLAQFRTPPKGFGEVAFFWWQGDRVTREKLRWILDQLKDAPISGLQINYCHSDSGGLQWGLTLESDPKPLTEDWWELFGWFLDQCRPYGIALSLSDYTLGAPGQGFYVDAVLRDHPEFLGRRLLWDGETVSVETVPHSLNPMAPGSGDTVADYFYGEFDRRFPGACGRDINYFFSDELNFNIRGKLWCDDFAAEFQARKGYDLRPKLRALFEDIGDETEKIRLDYYDVIVQLSEERYFIPVHRWHESRGMTFGCDHGGRGKDVTEFGDYFRTMRWNGAPGNDQPHLESDIIKTKVSASICHLYGRTRTWLEGFYSSGWGTSSTQVADAVFRNFGLGHNLLSLHGLYYSMHGSRWEWAPPCNHFHMPYWAEMPHLLRCTERLSWLLSQGRHCCDVGIVYPVAAVEAYGEAGEASVQTAFAAGEILYRAGIDFDFLDFESIVRGEIQGDTLQIGENRYRAVILPDMAAVRYAMLERLARWAETGGMVVVLGRLPRASDNAGRNDPALEALCRTLRLQGRFTAAEALPDLLHSSFIPDFRGQSRETPYFQHRTLPEGELYFVYGLPRNTVCTFRTGGVPVLLDPWTGEAAGLVPGETREGVTTLALPQAATVPNLLLFRPEAPAGIGPLPEEPSALLDLTGLWETTLEPTLDNRFGDYRLPPTAQCLGPELPVARYRVTEADCTAPDLDHSGWDETPLGYGPRLWTASDRDVAAAEAAAMEAPTAAFAPYSFSWRYGRWDDSGDQHSYHGLKGLITDDFLAFGEKTVLNLGSNTAYTGAGGFYAFTTVSCDAPETVAASFGRMKPDGFWVNHRPADPARVQLEAGENRILAHFPACGRTHLVLYRPPLEQSRQPQAMTWFQNPSVLPLDACPDRRGRSCWFRFTAPPGLVSLELPTPCRAACWCEGRPMGRQGREFFPDAPRRTPAQITVCVTEAEGRHGGGVFDGPIRFRCGPGLLPLGDWSELDGLRWYSGGIRYAKTFDPGSTPRTVTLDLGTVVSAVQVFVNGRRTAILCAPPFRAALTLEPGPNRVELLVHNTLANHMRTIPTIYHGPVESGLRCSDPSAFSRTQR